MCADASRGNVAADPYIMCEIWCRGVGYCMVRVVTPCIPLLEELRYGTCSVHVATLWCLLSAQSHVYVYLHMTWPLPHMVLWNATMVHEVQLRLHSQHHHHAGTLTWLRASRGSSTSSTASSTFCQSVSRYATSGDTSIPNIANRYARGLSKSG